MSGRLNVAVARDGVSLAVSKTSTAENIHEEFQPKPLFAEASWKLSSIALLSVVTLSTRSKIDGNVGAPKRLGIRQSVVLSRREVRVQQLHCPDVRKA